MPTDIDIRKPISCGEDFPVVLLRSSRAVREILREEGWHSGYFWDDVTGQDNGVRRLFASTASNARRRAGLRDIVHALHEEVRETGSGVVTLWHDQITPDMVKAKGIKVIEIATANAHQAQAKLRLALDRCSFESVARNRRRAPTLQSKLKQPKKQKEMRHG